jgi:hypothetical protein
MDPSFVPQVSVRPPRFWTVSHDVIGGERLTGALLDRLTHHVHILQMNGESYRLAQSKQRRRGASPPADPRPPAAQ